MEYCRLQTGCLLIVVYIAFTYFRACKRYHKNVTGSMFDKILILSMILITYTGASARYPGMHGVVHIGVKDVQR